MGNGWSGIWIPFYFRRIGNPAGYEVEDFFGVTSIGVSAQATSRLMFVGMARGVCRGAGGCVLLARRLGIGVVPERSSCASCLAKSVWLVLYHTCLCIFRSLKWC